MIRKKKGIPAVIGNAGLTQIIQLAQKKDSLTDVISMLASSEKSTRKRECGKAKI